MNQKSGDARRPSGQGFTEKQGQYLAFIYAYSRMFRRSPAEADMQRHFRVSPPSVHQMVRHPRTSRPDPTSTRRRRSAFGMFCSMMKELIVGMITSLLPFTTSVGCLIVFR